MVISTNLGYLGSYHQKEKKNIEEKKCTVAKSVYSGLVAFSLFLIRYIKSAYHSSAVEVITHLCLQRGSWNLTECTAFFNIDFRK